MGFENTAYRPRLDQLDGTGGSEATQPDKLAYLKEAVAPITPQALLPLRLLSSPSYILPAIVLARHHDWSSVADLHDEVNMLQEQDSSDEKSGWNIGKTVVQQFVGKGAGLGIIETNMNSTPMLARISPDQADTLYAAGGHIAKLLAGLWENGERISSQELLGRTRYSPDKQDPIWVRARIAKALVTGIKKEGAGFSLTAEQLASVVGISSEQLMPYLKTLDDKLGMVTHIVREKGTFALELPFDPDAITVTGVHVGVERLQEVYKAIEIVLQGKFGLLEPDVISAREVREALQAINKNSPLLDEANYTGEDGVSKAIAKVMQAFVSLGVLKRLETTTIYTSQDQSKLLESLVGIIDGVTAKDPVFIQNGRNEMDQLLGDSTRLTDFMVQMRDSSPSIERKSLTDQQQSFLDLISEHGGKLSTSEILQLVHLDNSYLTQHVLAPLQEVGLLTSHIVKIARGTELEWSTPTFAVETLIKQIDVERLIQEGGFMIVERESKRSTVITRSQVRAIGTGDMNMFIDTLSDEGKGIVKDLLKMPGRSIEALPIMQFADGRESVLLIIKPGSLQFYKNDEVSPTVLDSNAGANLSIFIHALANRLEKTFAKNGTVSGDTASLIKDRLFKFA